MYIPIIRGYVRIERIEAELFFIQFSRHLYELKIYIAVAQDKGAVAIVWHKFQRMAVTRLHLKWI